MPEPVVKWKYSSVCAAAMACADSKFAIRLALWAAIVAASAARHPPGYTVNVTLPTEASKHAGGQAQVLRATRGPCTCLDGGCSCCTGVALDSIGQKGCVHIEYDPDDFLIAVRMSLNNKTMYKNVMSGKNPRPFCVPVPRLRFLSLCTRLSNVFLTGRNVHACIDMEGRILNTPMFEMSFDCVRVGAQGVALLSPEDGGGLPAVQPSTPTKPAAPAEEEEGEDYDQLAPDYDIDQNQHVDKYSPTPINLVPTTPKPAKATTVKAKTKKAGSTTPMKVTTRTTTPRTATTKVETSSQRAAEVQVEPEDTQKTIFRKPRE